MKKTIATAMGILFILFCLSLAGAQKVKTVDGVTVVSNGKKPSPVKGQPTKIALTEELSVGGGDNPDEAFSEVSVFVVDREGSIYALDFKDRKIKAFDREGKFLGAIGKQGQGPGEVDIPSGIQITADNNLMVEDAASRRLAIFKTSGEFIKNISFASRLGLVGIIIDAKGNLVGREMGLAEGNARMFFETKKFDPNIQPLFTLDKIEFPIPIPGSGAKINVMDLASGYQFDADGNIYYGRNAAYEIKIYNPEGKHIRTIQKEYEPVKVTQQDIDEILERIPTGVGPVNVKEMFTFPEYFPPFQSFSLDDQGRMYVRTFIKGKVKNEYVFEVFDAEGRFFAQFISKAELSVFKKDKAYGIEEDDEGFRVIKRYAVAWQ